MKKFVIILAIAIAILFTSVSTTTHAREDDNSSIAITVVVPRQDNPISPLEQPPPPTLPTLPAIYPIHVWESNENGRREVVRVYELRDNETSAQIPREPFIRDGFRFELAEIIRREIPSHSIREHTEIITITTQTNDLTTIMDLLNSTLDFVAPDGHFGVLALDVSTIRVESQGTRSSSHAVTRTREFPHLSNADTSLVPRTITEGGRTYNLTNVDWRTQTTSAVDYTQLSSSFTAVATFTGTATRTSTLGYTTTAEYRGQISKLSAGRQEFTAHFIGIPIVTPTVEVVHEPVAEEVIITEVTIETTVEPMSDVEKAEVATEPAIELETETKTPEKSEEVKDVEETTLDYYNDTSSGYEMSEADEDNSSRGISLPLAIILMAACTVIAYFAGKKGKAMLASMRKIGCVLLCISLSFMMLQQVYAAQIPDNPFGAHGNQPMHFAPNTTPTEHFNPNHAPSIAPTNFLQDSNAMHFAPNVVPSAHFNPSISSGYEYGDHIGVLTISRLNRTVNIFAGATMAAMDYGGGHFSFTGLNFGNTGLIGHNRGPVGFFNFVRYLQYGDILYLETGGITRRYMVTDRYIITETNLDSLMQFGDNRLTLITCVEYQRTQRRVAVALEI